ncbi:transporter [Streptomyces hoynatensis]|uniref:Transporter n=1 Tax=Streptomyces hoynatensis TaxID=1141874 RepID=A0A3A9Z4J0_9ACTN|nr:transporter [Streptomyces hoynatensis]RKN43130.1 transporter [Streptomyces hoynatensis]
MIWLTWRQFRTQAAVVLGALLLLGACLAVTGPGLAHDYAARGGGAQGATDFLEQVDGTGTTLYLVGSLTVLLLPALLGMFWGAPLITRELDAGTHRLVWTHTGRTRWLAAKLGVVGLGAMAACGLTALAMTWWAAPIDRATAALEGRPGPSVFTFARLHPLMFDMRGVAPFGYAAFAFLLGVTIGLLVRRTLPAMALLLAAFTLTQVFMATSVRPHLMTPVSATAPIDASHLTFVGRGGGVEVTVDEPGAWITSQHTVKDGRPTSPPSWVVDCPAQAREGSADCYGELAAQGYLQRVDYHPADRFWAFQWRETVLHLALALALAGFCAWWLRGRAF